jgi:hypothetical protein
VDLKKEFPWLDVRADGMRCTMCCASDAAFHIKFGGNKYWTENQPTNAFKSAKKISLKKHAQTAVHVAIARENAEAGRRLNAGQKDRPLEQAAAAAAAKHKKAIEARLRTVYHLAKSNQSLEQYKGLFDLQMMNGVFDGLLGGGVGGAESGNANYNSHQFQREMLKALADCTRDETMKRVHAPPFVAVIMDETYVSPADHCPPPPPPLPSLAFRVIPSHNHLHAHVWRRLHDLPQALIPRKWF